MAGKARPPGNPREPAFRVRAPDPVMEATSTGRRELAVPDGKR